MEQGIVMLTAAVLVVLGTALAAGIAMARSPLGRAVRVQFAMLAERSSGLD